MSRISLLFRLLLTPNLLEDSQTNTAHAKRAHWHTFCKACRINMMQISLVIGGDMVRCW